MKYLPKDNIETYIKSFLYTLPITDKANIDDFSIKNITQYDIIGSLPLKSGSNLICTFNDFECLINTRDYGNAWYHYNLNNIDKISKETGNIFISDYADYIEECLFGK